MSVIAELRVDEGEFELGRILRSTEDLDIELETMVPLRHRPVPFFLVHGDVTEAFEDRIERHPTVQDLTPIERNDGYVLYAIEWDASRDHLFNSMDATGAQLVSGRNGGRSWAFEIRFPSHAALSEFRDLCDDARITITVDHIYQPTEPRNSPGYGLTELQRETLARAVEGGYYDIPRRMSTNDLSEEFDVSDQAITERLRRAIVGLTEHTIAVPDPEDEDEQ